MQMSDAEAQAAQNRQRGQDRAEDICAKSQTLLLEAGQLSSGSCTVIMAHLG